MLLFAATTRVLPCQNRADDSVPAVPVILDVRIGYVTAATMSALRAGDTALLPRSRVLALAGIRFAGPAEGYLSVDSLSVLLRAPITVDWDDLTVTVVDDGSLPVSRRAARARLRRTLAARTPLPVSRRGTDLRLPNLSHSVVFDYDVSANVDLAHLDAMVGIGADLLGGGLTLDVRRAPGQRDGLSTLSWQREWPDGHGIRHLAIGRIHPTVASPITSGIFVSSNAVARGNEPDPIAFTGTLPGGWDVEAFRNDVLVYAGTVDSIGEYRVVLPASHGPNRFRLSAHGPLDEELHVERYVSIGSELLPEGTTSLEAAIGRCDRSVCDYGATLSGRLAPIASLTAGVDLTVGIRSQHTELFPSTQLAARVRDDLNATIHYSPLALVAEIRYAPRPAFDLVATRGMRRVALRGSRLTIDQSSATVSAIWRDRTNRAVTASLEFTGHDGQPGARTLRVASLLSVGAIRLRPFASMEHLATSATSVMGYGTIAESAVPFLLPAGTLVRAALADARSGERSLRLSLPVAHHGRIELGAQWIMAVRAPRLSTTMSFDTPFARYEARSARWESMSRMQQRVTGSVLLSPYADVAAPVVALRAEQMRGRAEIAGTVFLDENRNGRRDLSERPLPSAVVVAGPATAEADSAGRYRLRDIAPFVPVVLSVDPLSLPIRGATSRAVRVVPWPNGVTPVDIPVVSDPSKPLPGDAIARCGFPENTQGSHTSAVHRDHLQTSVRDPDTVADAWKSAEPSEDVPAKSRPVALGHVQIVIGASIDERERTR